MPQSKNKSKHIETLCVHGKNAKSVSATGARSVPIHQSCGFVFKNTQQADNRFHLREGGYIYSRINNPTVAALEERLSLLEGGVGATCTASGLAASLLAFSAIMNSGDSFISSCKIYGGTTSQFRDTFGRAFGWNCSFVDPTDTDQFKRALTEKTKLIFTESVSNPENAVVDIEAVARIAEDAGVPLIVDNTVATPYLCRPFDYGANIITHSTTKYLSGHGQAMGGAVIDGGNFDWKAHGDKFTALAQNDPSYHLNFTDTFPESPFAVHNHAVGLRDLGMNQQANNAYLTLLGMETLHIRMERHSRNAQKVAEFLEGHEAVSWVSYAGLKSSPYYDLGQKYLRDGLCSALFTFGMKGGYDAARKVVENTKIFSHVANIGDTKSLIIHPASTTHSELSEEQKIKAGALPESIRLSVGIENADDLIADLKQALN